MMPCGVAQKTVRYQSGVEPLDSQHLSLLCCKRPLRETTCCTSRCPSRLREDPTMFLRHGVRRNTTALDVASTSSMAQLSWPGALSVFAQLKVSPVYLPMLFIWSGESQTTDARMMDALSHAMCSQLCGRVRCGGAMRERPSPGIGLDLSLYLRVVGETATSNVRQGAPS